MIALDLTTVIKAALTDLAASSSIFEAAVESTGRTWPAADITAWYQTLFPSASAAKIAVGIRYTPDMAAKCAIWIDDTDSPYGPRVLGDFMQWSSGSKLVGGIRTQTATVYIVHESNELCTVLWIALQARLTLMVPKLMNAGYKSFDYTGGGTISAMDLAMNGWTQVFVRTMSFSATLQQQLADTVNPILDRNLSVLPEGAVSPTGIEGAVIAASVE